MLTRRFRTAVLALLAAGLLTYLAHARVSGTERLVLGMPLLQAHLVMLSTAEQEPVFYRTSGSVEHIEEQRRNNSYPNPDLMPRRCRWEDATHLVVVRIADEGPLSIPQIVDLNRIPKSRTEYGTAWAWRLVAGVTWLWALVLLFRAAFEPKPAVALNSPGAPDTTNGAGSSA